MFKGYKRPMERGPAEFEGFGFNQQPQPQPDFGELGFYGAGYGQKRPRF